MLEKLKRIWEHGTEGQVNRMDGDLISRETLIEEIMSFRCSLTGLRSGKGMLALVADQYRKSILQIIEDQPTAFDKEKVVLELQEAKELDVYVPLEDGMRTREMSMADYNIPDDEYKRLIEYCKSMGVDDRLWLFQCAISAAPGLEIPIYESVISGSGYRTMVKNGRYIPAKEDDFYAYRRKTLAEFYDWLRLFGKWEKIKCGEK